MFRLRALQRKELTMKEGRQLTVKEFYNLNKVISQCTKYAIQQTQKAINNDREYTGSQVSNTWFNLMYNCYLESNYVQDMPSEYKEYVRDQLRMHLQNNIGLKFKDQDLLKIMIPVLFYSLVIRHEGKKQTVKRRKNKIDKAKSSKKEEPIWKNIDLFRYIDSEYYMDLEKEAAFSKRLATQKSLMEKCAYKDNSIINTNYKDVLALCEKFEGHLHWLHCLGDIARMGTFLYDVLNIPEDTNHNLNTIIRLQIIESFQNIRQCCSSIIYKENKDNYDKKIPYNTDVLMAYGMLTSDIYWLDADEICPMPIFFTGEGEFRVLEVKRDSLDTKDTFSTFSALYSYLVKNFRFDTADLIDQLLGKEALTPLISCDINITDFISTNIKLLRLISNMKEMSDYIDNYTVIGRFIAANEQVMTHIVPVHNFSSFEEEYEYLLNNQNHDDLEDFDDIEWFDPEQPEKEKQNNEDPSDNQPISMDEAIQQLIDGMRKSGLIK